MWFASDNTHGAASSLRVACAIDTGNETRAPEGNGTKSLAWLRSSSFWSTSSPLVLLRVVGTRIE